jgi:hypothetical protein
MSLSLYYTVSRTFLRWRHHGDRSHHYKVTGLYIQHMIKTQNHHTEYGVEHRGIFLP